MKNPFSPVYTVVLRDQGGYLWTSYPGETDYIFHSERWGGSDLSYQELLEQGAPLSVIFYEYTGADDRVHRYPWIDSRGAFHDPLEERRPQPMP